MQNTQNRFLRGQTLQEKQIFNNFQNFGKQDQTTKTTIAYIIGLLTTAEERDSLEANFKKFDLNKDGLLSFDEISKGFKRVYGENLTTEQLRQIFNQVDTDGSGYIDYNEFIAATMDTTLLLTTEKLKMLFRQLDKDNTGSISLQELYNSLGNVKKGSEEFIHKLLKGLTDQKQIISYQDFLDLLSIKIDEKPNNKDVQLDQVSQILQSKLLQTKKPRKLQGKSFFTKEKQSKEPDVQQSNQ